MASSLNELVVNLDDDNDKFNYLSPAKQFVPDHMGIVCTKVFIHMNVCQTLVSYIHMGLPDKDAL